MSYSRKDPMKSYRVLPKNLELPLAITICKGNVAWNHALCSIRDWGELRDGTPCWDGSEIPDFGEGLCPSCGVPGCDWWEKPQ